MIGFQSFYSFSIEKKKKDGKPCAEWTFTLPVKIAWNARATESATSWWWRWRSAWAGDRIEPVAASRSMLERDGPIGWCGRFGRRWPGEDRNVTTLRLTTLDRANRWRPPIESDRLESSAPFHPDSSSSHSSVKWIRKKPIGYGQPNNDQSLSVRTK